MGSSVRTLIHSATLADAGELQPDSWVLLATEGVVASGTGDSWGDLVERGTTVIDAQELAGSGALLTPGSLTFTATVARVTLLMMAKPPSVRREICTTCTEPPVRSCRSSPPISIR